MFRHKEQKKKKKEKRKKKEKIDVHAPLFWMKLLVKAKKGTTDLWIPTIYQLECEQSNFFLCKN